MDNNEVKIYPQEMTMADLCAMKKCPVCGAEFKDEGGVYGDNFVMVSDRMKDCIVAARCRKCNTCFPRLAREIRAVEDDW